MHGLRPLQRERRERFRLQVGGLAGARFVEAVGGGELHQLLPRAVHLFHLLVRGGCLLVEDLEDLIALRVT